MNGNQEQIALLGGPVTVAYRKQGNEWLCTALEFDLLGIGKTRKDAFTDLRDVFDSYMEAVLNVSGPVQFLYHSEAVEWQTPDKEKYLVVVVIRNQKNTRRPPQVIADIERLKPYRNRISACDLVPVLG